MLERSVRPPHLRPDQAARNTSLEIFEKNQKEGFKFVSETHRISQCPDASQKEIKQITSKNGFQNKGKYNPAIMVARESDNADVSLVGIVCGVLKVRVTPESGADTSIVNRKVMDQ